MLVNFRKEIKLKEIQLELELPLYPVEYEEPIEEKSGRGVLIININGEDDDD
jgi:hypothetical protein